MGFRFQCAIVMLVGCVLAIPATASLMQGSFTGTATDSGKFLYIAPETGEAVYESFDGAPVSGSFSVDLGSLVYTGGDTGTAHYEILSPVSFDFVAEGLHTVFADTDILFGYPSMTLTQGATHQSVTFAIQRKWGYFSMTLSALPGQLFSALDPHTLSAGTVDPSASTASFNQYFPSPDAGIHADIMLTQVTLSMVPAPTTLLLIGIAFLAFGATGGLRALARPWSHRAM